MYMCFSTTTAKCVAQCVSQIPKLHVAYTSTREVIMELHVVSLCDEKVYPCFHYHMIFLGNFYFLMIFSWDQVRMFAPTHVTLII